MNQVSVLHAYKYRLLPRSSQIPFLAAHFGAVRFIYNYFLDLRKRSYDHGTSLSGFDCKKMLHDLKAAYPWLKEVNSQSLQESVLDLEKAYVRFFRKLGGYPKHERKRGRQSFTVPQHFTIKGSYLFIPKLKTGLKVKFHRPLQGDLKSCTISREPSGKYFVSFSVEGRLPVPEKKDRALPHRGIDLGVVNFCTFSDGASVQAPRYLRHSLKKFARLHRGLSRKVKGSRNKEKARVRLARLHEHIRNQRLDFLHQLSLKVVHDNQVICLEDLNVRGMMRFGHLGLSIADAGIGEFVRQLKYKAEWHGRTVIQIGRFYPSSKTCSACGYVDGDLTLADTEWNCPSCGSHHHRDHNAAKNIMSVGRDTPEVTPAEKRTSVLSMKAMRNHARREDKSASRKQDAKASKRVAAAR